MEIYEKPLGLLRYYSIVFGQRADNELAKYFPNSLTTGWFGCAKGIYIGNWKRTPVESFTRNCIQIRIEVDDELIETFHQIISSSLFTYRFSGWAHRYIYMCSHGIGGIWQHKIIRVEA